MRSSSGQFLFPLISPKAPFFFYVFFLANSQQSNNQGLCVWVCSEVRSLCATQGQDRGHDPRREVVGKHTGFRMWIIVEQDWLCPKRGAVVIPGPQNRPITGGGQQKSDFLVW